ncbi:DUF3310 domain-containing protein [Alteromonas mediterranea]|uniref:DUF3310 domain-containing protein n=1 Tax=Alteromonas mediterranea (strain DSM 17117 / CIP 110805 / LMG 28347 / Deep ecotype) TaxID=1774373 RepID=F2GCA1_ALTMD|nr:DUF3310 domain-containing protein [Alteromonas mediterranea]AEA99057.2 hypothetical protein MADE_1014615 [Alteromonas mediterranea DE]
MSHYDDLLQEMVNDHTKPVHDPVNNPKHYDLFPDQQAIDVIRAALTPEEFAGYCKGNALKYRLRAGNKDKLQQDIDKSEWYRNKLFETPLVDDQVVK